MKKVSFLKLLAVAFSLLIFSACSKQQYSFAPGTGGYHGEIKKASITAQALPVEENSVFTASQTDVTPEATANQQTEAAAALAQNFTAKKEAKATPEIATKVGKKETRQTIKLAKQELKSLKKEIKESKGSGLNSTVKLLLILGLIFVILGSITAHVLTLIGVILLLIALFLLLMEIL